MVVAAAKPTSDSGASSIPTARRRTGMRKSPRDDRRLMIITTIMPRMIWRVPVTVR